jgi:hypothetical protein
MSGIDGTTRNGELNVRVMESFKKVLAKEHPDTPSSMANISRRIRNQGRQITKSQYRKKYFSSVA